MDEQQKQLIADMKGLVETLKAAGDNEKKIEALTGQIATMETEIKALNQREAGFRVSGIESEFGLDAKDAKSFATGALLKGLHAQAIQQKHGVSLDRVEGYTGKEKELSDQMIKKTAEFGMDSSGGVFVPTSVMSDFVEKLRANPKLLLSLGARMTTLPAGAGVFQLPRKTTNSVAYDLAENGAPTASDLGWEMKTLSPHRTSALSSVSDRLTFSVGDYQRMLQDDLMVSLLLNIQLKALYGNGINGAPTGLKYDAAALSFALGGGSAGKVARFTDVAKFEDKLALADADITGAKLLTRPEVIRSMKTERTDNYSGQTTNKAPVFGFQPMQMTDKQLAEAMGYEFARLTQILGGQTVGGDTDCTDIFFGDFSQLEIMTWGAPKIKVSREATIGGVSAFASNLLYIMADVDYDILWRQPKQVLVVTGCKTTAVTGE